MPGVIIDIGTGDGKLVYELAKQYPDRLIIGIDPSHKSLIEKSSRVSKKKEKGGVINALYILASVENLPDELKDTANQIFINFPWGSLLDGVVKVDELIWKNIKQLCRAGAFIDILLGYDLERDNSNISKGGLPALDESYIKNSMLPKFKVLELEPLLLERINSGQLKEYPSSWAKKLSYGRERDFYHIRLRAT